MDNNGFAEGYAVGQGNANNGGWGNGAWGAEWLWIIVLFALFGNNGWGFGGNGGWGKREPDKQRGPGATGKDAAGGV